MGSKQNALSRSGTVSRVEVRRKPTTGVSTTAISTVGDDPLLVTRLVIAFLIDAFVRFHGQFTPHLPCPRLSHIVATPHTPHTPHRTRTHRNRK